MERQIPAFLTLFMRFLDFVSEDEGDFHQLELIFRRRLRFINRYLERRRVIAERIAAGRTVYFTTYVGTWFNQYPEIQFRKDLRLSKTAFRVIINFCNQFINCFHGIIFS